MKREKQGSAAPPASSAPTSDAILDQPETRIVLAAVALHGMLAGKTALPQHAADQSQDERRQAAAERLADDAFAVADAMIKRGSIPR